VNNPGYINVTLPIKDRNAPVKIDYSFLGDDPAGARPTIFRISRSNSSASFTFSLRSFLTFSLPWPNLSPLYEQVRAGKVPTGIRTPSWDFSRSTLKLIRELALVYDSSLMADDRPYELVEDGKPTGIVELPVEWLLDDYPYFGFSRYSSVRPHIKPMDVFEIWVSEFDKAYEEGTLFILTMHPKVSFFLFSSDFKFDANNPRLASQDTIVRPKNLRSRNPFLHQYLRHHQP